MNKDNNKILSVKIVTVDYYNTQPIPKIDVTHSEFRGNPISSIPVVRIFGITADKRKICCNIHNNFPYIFCPCPENDLSKIDLIMKEMATQIDQKLNASFGQSNSNQKHVYKISLCKGIPYYGYHAGHHQFFRIELYNPNLIKRTAALLHHGQILGKMFQPHESHIPYVLKFFIDYNLFGMSYLHVPLSKVHTRLSTSEGKYKKRSISHLEVDFDVAYILNRTALNENNDSGSQKAANIGIESIWEDERRRRSELDATDLPELKPPDDEIRVCDPTESDLFFLKALKERYTSLNSQSFAESSDEISLKGHSFKKKFDLKLFLDSSTYAAEFTQSSVSSKEEGEPSCSMEISQTITELEQQFLNIQNDDSCENEIKEITALMANEEDSIENDSLLAPLSQIPADQMEVPNDRSLSVTKNHESNELIENSDEDEGDEFNMTIADLEAKFCAFSDDTLIPQLDGLDDEIEMKNTEKPAYKILSQDIQTSLQNLASFLGESSKSSDTKMNNSNEDSMKNQDVYKSDSDEEMMKSFYDQTFNDFQDSDISMDEIRVKEEPSTSFIGENNQTCTITPKIEPPDPSEVFEKLLEYDLPTTINPLAIYSNPNDMTEKKEVGYNILEIKSDKLNDFENFKSLLYDENQMNLYQKESITLQHGFTTKNTKNIQNLIYSSEKDAIIYPINDPPTYNDAKNWIQSFVGDQIQFKDEVNPEQESPVKMKREKILMGLKMEDNSEESSQDLDRTLVPETPKQQADDPVIIPSSLEKDPSNLSEYLEEGIYMSYSARKSRKRKMKKSFSRRFQEIMRAKAASSLDDSAPNSPAIDEKFSDSSEDILKEPSSSIDVNTCSPSMIQDANFPNDSFDTSKSSFSDTFGFKMKLESLHSNDEHTDLTILSMELHTQTVDELKPNPLTDEICAIFYSVEGFYVDMQATSVSGIIINYKSNMGYFKEGNEIIKVDSELELLEQFFKKIRLYDPDIFAGYEIELSSWGYLIERGMVLNMNLCNALSRMPTDKEYKKQNVVDEEENIEQGDYQTEQRVPGRILLDVWRLMRHEIATTSYTFENICYHILHRRYPKHSYSFLTNLWKNPLKMWIVLEYYMTRTTVLLEILKQLDLIGRTCELAKLFGIQFFEVLSRGSQFRVESMMIRIAKRRNYVAVSPSTHQRTHMRAPEYIALMLEPESRFYTDPVIVLDFQSLYPSIIIAYNYCFSTCLGRVEHLLKGSSQPFEFGAYQLRVSPEKLQHFLDNDLVTVSPCGVAFLKSSVREGVLRRMLKEILDTRVMVKQSMKLYKNNTALQRILHSRQLGLKLIANVTYGYTAANYSGRMPAIELGDSVVSKGRETLERAIRLVENNDKWKCRVCYGDTDSMFVLVPGRTREEAFKLGEEIAEAVTKDNPFPIKLKLEKVYQPCILQTKKRYVGNMYETPDQKEPVFEAKGIETVRRDGCPAASKTLEKTLKILFETYDVSKVKEYVCKQFIKILEGRCSIQDLTIAKEFRGISGYKERAVVPALTLTRKWKTIDPRNEPRAGERVPFVLVNGPPNSTLIRLVKTPLDVLNDENQKINSLYYIKKSIIPPLNRCLLLIGANAMDWFEELPKIQQSLPVNILSNPLVTRKGTISQFFGSTNCVICDNFCDRNICETCISNSQETFILLSNKIVEIERKLMGVRQICQACCGRSFNFCCISLDCPTLYSLSKIKRDFQQVENYRHILSEIF